MCGNIIDGIGKYVDVPEKRNLSICDQLYAGKYFSYLNKN